MELDIPTLIQGLIFVVISIMGWMINKIYIKADELISSVRDIELNQINKFSSIEERVKNVEKEVSELWKEIRK